MRMGMLLAALSSLAVSESQHATAGNEFDLREIYGDSGSYHFKGHIHRLGTCDALQPAPTQPPHRPCHPVEDGFGFQFVYDQVLVNLTR
jgi:hypothetical protein